MATSSSLTSLTTIWPGVTDFRDLLADGLGSYLVDERSDDIKCHVRF